MTASLPDIGTQSVFSSVPKSKKEKRYTNVCITLLIKLNHLLKILKTHQVSSHCCGSIVFVFQLLQGRGGDRGQTVSKYALKVCPCSRIYACT